ncbi:HAD-IB family phosphatase, partial [Salmonella enterica]|uniref:HAD-IB family phosphatase n=1 Tax=Salmonella enterica TaxID=28901 RepID=UPI0011199077
SSDLKGTPKAVLNAVCDRMTLSPGLLTILPVIKAKGFKTAIISGGLDIFTQRLKERYQLDYAFSNTVEIRDNVLTDNITLPIMNAANKKQTLVDLAARLNIATENIIACGDGANDLPMLEHAGTGIACWV